MPGVLHAGSYGGGFAAGSSAEVEEGFVGLWIQKLNSQQGAWVLDVKCAVFEAGQCVGGAVVREELFMCPVELNPIGLRGFVKRVTAGIGLCGAVVPIKQR